MRRCEPRRLRRKEQIGFSYIGVEALARHERREIPACAALFLFVDNTAFSGTTYQEGGALRLGCAVQIVTDKSGIITKIKPTADSIGMWQLRAARRFLAPSRFALRAAYILTVSSARKAQMSRFDI